MLFLSTAEIAQGTGGGGDAVSWNTLLNGA